MTPFPHHSLRRSYVPYCLAVLLLVSGVSRPASAAGEQDLESTRVTEEFLATGYPVGRPGGRLVTALRAEPKTLNPLLSAHIPSRTVLRRIMSNLIQINRQSQETEPALAKSWTISEDGRRYRLKLRRGVRFSDGQPFDADDVIFTFRVYLDEDVGSTNRDLLMVQGEPIAVRKVASHTVEFEMPAPYAVGERLFDGIAVLPRHILEKRYNEGKLAEVWSVTAPPRDVVGLGPFRLKEYLPGERCVLERNPHYWKVDQAGRRLPYLDEIVFLFVPSDDAQVVRFQAGDTDVIDNLSSESYALLDRQASNRGYQLFDLGPGLTYYFLVFNQNELSPSDEASITVKQRWFRDLAFRRAVSAAIDRAGIERLVFQNKATALWSHVTPGNKRWLHADLGTQQRSVGAARAMLRGAGFAWDENQRLIDSEGELVEFSIVTSSSNSQRVRMATIIQEDLKALGMGVRVVPLEFRALAERITRSYEYEASILALSGGDADPNAQMPVLLSKGSLHFWRLGQSEPATPWEAEIDRLMEVQVSEMDYGKRKRIFDMVQELMAENLPLIFLASPHVLVGAKENLGNFQPAILDHPTLWNADELFLRN